MARKALVKRYSSSSSSSRVGEEVHRLHLDRQGRRRLRRLGLSWTATLYGGRVPLWELLRVLSLPHDLRLNNDNSSNSNSNSSSN